MACVRRRRTTRCRRCLAPGSVALDSWRPFTDRLRKWQQCRSDWSANLKGARENLAFVRRRVSINQSCHRRLRLLSWPEKLGPVGRYCPLTVFQVAAGKPKEQGHHDNKWGARQQPSGNNNLGSGNGNPKPRYCGHFSHSAELSFAKHPDSPCFPFSQTSSSPRHHTGLALCQVAHPRRRSSGHRSRPDLESRGRSLEVYHQHRRHHAFKAAPTRLRR